MEKMLKNKISKIDKYVTWRTLNQPDGEEYEPSFMGEIFGLTTAIRILKGDLEILKNGKIDDKKILKRLEEEQKTTKESS